MKMTSRALVWILLPLVLVSLLVEVRMARNRLRADRLVRQVETLTMVALQSGRVPRTVTAANLRLLREAEELVPYEISIPIAKGSQYLIMGRPEEALKAYSEALERESRPEIYLNMGRAYRLAGQEQAAQGSFVLAVRLSPRLRKEIPSDIRKKVVARARNSV